jgi:hypothetical protein
MLQNTDRDNGLRSGTSMAKVLEIARDIDGALLLFIRNVLESSVTRIWRKIQAQPYSYIMTRNEFTVFNFFQCCFQGQDHATIAKKRYWDHMLEATVEI